MTTKIAAINAYRPRIEYGKTLSNREFIKYIGDRTGVNEGEIDLILREQRDAIIFFCLRGVAVKLEGLGTYQPSIDVDGNFDIAHRLDNAIRNALNTPNAFNGTIIHRENIGKTSDQLVEMWNKDHPDDPVA